MPGKATIQDLIFQIVNNSKKYELANSKPKL